MNTHLSVPATMPTSTVMARINAFLDQHVLPYPVKYLTNRITILATLCLLVPLIVLANVTVFVLAANSYLNVMSVVVSSTVLLYSTLAEARDRAAAQRREEIAAAHEAMVERRAEADHELIQEIHTHLDEIRRETIEHISVSLDNIQQMLFERMEKMQEEDHLHIEEMHKAVLTSTEAHRQELTSLSQLVAAMQNSLTGGIRNTPG
jgi:DNA anti-recombination protein RmuC